MATGVSANQSVFDTSGKSSVSGDYQPISGDFNGDRNGDIFWYGPGNKPDYIWFGRSNKTFDTNRKIVADNVTQSITGTYTPLSGDFNGDGTTDIFWYGVGKAPDFIWLGLRSGSFSNLNASVNGVYRPIVGDFNGDNKDDIFWYGVGGTADFIWYGKCQ